MPLSLFIFFAAIAFLGCGDGDGGGSRRVEVDLSADPIGGTSFILDVTNSAARDWFAGKLADFLRLYDLDGIKLDRGEEHIPSAVTDI